MQKVAQWGGLISNFFFFPSGGENVQQSVTWNREFHALLNTNSVIFFTQTMMMMMNLLLKFTTQT